MNRLKRLINSRMFQVTCLIILQACLLYLMLFIAIRLDTGLTTLLTILSALIVIYVLNKHGNPVYKMAWTIIILSIPLVGGVSYLLFGGRKMPKNLSRSMLKSLEESSIFQIQSKEADKLLYELDSNIQMQYRYVKDNASFPYHINTQTSYFPSGEAMLSQYLEDLKQAKHFIFLEYFIIEEGQMWDGVLAILKEKVSQGVKVYVMYDDAGCLETLDYHYDDYLKEIGIQAVIFNPISAKLVVTMNNRDHRKMTIIDNQIAYTGGINLADEYINQKQRFGYWKDSALRFEGEAVWNYTVTFIQFYNAIVKGEHLNYHDFKIEHDFIPSSSLVLPFSDSPTDEEEVGRSVHLNMINKARRYIYIHTPYLIIDHEIIVALSLARKNGVEVVISTPHIPDKWYAFGLTQNSYQELLSAGIKIYEFTPGFLHSKTFISDDEIALVGSINMDYRSYYLHYECGVLLNDPKTLESIKKDFIDTFAQSQEITLASVEQTPFYKRVFRSILNLFSPLM
ncbi:MAG: cardiolipin synthase [Erysipelotrichaceae bacterium]